MGNYYEGSFLLRLKKDIPERLKTLLKDLQTKNWWTDSTLCRRAYEKGKGENNVR